MLNFLVVCTEWMFIHITVERQLEADWERKLDIFKDVKKLQILQQ